MIRCKAKVSSYGEMVKSMRAAGLIIRSTARERCCTQMAQSTKVNSRMALAEGKASLRNPMALSISARGGRTSRMA